VSLEDRYSRQHRLPEIGDDGQQRIHDANLRVSGGDGAVVETVYLLRVGVERVEIMPSQVAPAFAHAAFFHFDAPRRVGAGSWRALGKIRDVLGVGRQTNAGAASESVRVTTEREDNE
jgi:hypothetical protein